MKITAPWFAAVTAITLFGLQAEPRAHTRDQGDISVLRAAQVVTAETTSAATATDPTLEQPPIHVQSAVEAGAESTWPLADRLARLLRGITRRAARTLPEKMAATGDGTQLITAVTNGRTNASRDGKLTWWKRAGGHWVKIGSTRARFGVNGLSDSRVEGDGTTPTGLFTLPMAFGIAADPGTAMPWKKVRARSWWNENSRHSRYNSWQQNCPRRVCWTSATRAAHSSERLADYVPQYSYSVLIGFNTGMVKVRPPARPSGSGIFLHVLGSGHTAGCIAVRRSAMVSILRWLDPAASPHIAIGNARSISGF
jgi:L,D-peptidoglycan transpeptidase YkuD (ErfK/YbiS/YcfS/YnhG family)